MPSDPFVSDSRGFDLEAAREASLTATLSRVRLCRRVRRGATMSMGLLAAAAAVWLAIPTPDPSISEALPENPLVVRTSPLTAGQRIVSRAEPHVLIRTPAEPAAALRMTTPYDVAVPRLGEAEFHSLLASHEVYCIQLGGDLPQVLPLHPE